MKLNYFLNALRKNKIFLLIIFLGLSYFSFLINYNYFSFLINREGYGGYCATLKNCKDCVNSKVTDTTTGCYWSESKKDCSNYLSGDYSRKCPEQKCPDCEPCPKLIKLKDPTYITNQ